MAQFTQRDLSIARVLNEDSDFLILEVAKTDDVEFHLDTASENNRFYTVMFVKNDDAGSAVVWKPWEHSA